jgi:hypothetical protein
VDSRTIDRRNPGCQLIRRWGCLGPVAPGRVVEQGHPPHHETTERTDPQ